MVLRIKGIKIQIRAMFKERIDSLFSYQKKLHDIITSTSTDVEGEHEQRPEVKIKAITELHAIEVTLFTCGNSYQISM